MNIYNYQEAFGAADKTSRAMRRAIDGWYGLYYGSDSPQGQDPCQRIAYTVVSKLIKTVFGEYKTQCPHGFSAGATEAMNRIARQAMQHTLVGGECYLKPWVDEGGVNFGVIPRTNVLIFARDGRGEPVYMGTVETTVDGKYYYTLLERRYLDAQGATVIENRLFRALNSQSLGLEVPLSQLARYAHLPKRYCYAMRLGGLGLVRLKNPSLNCVDGSADGVSVYAAAEGLIRAIDENEAQLRGEFSRGESRIVVSGDMLNAGQLTDHLFVGLDDDPQNVGITVFSPQLREQSFLNRKQEYLRNVESVIGLKRGTLSDSNEQQKTATEIASSAGDFNLTVIDFQQVWDRALAQGVELCLTLAKIQGLAPQGGQLPTTDWGNGVLYDEDKTWQDYVDMVQKGLLRPEYALAWRFNLPADTPEDLARIRSKYMDPGRSKDMEEL